MNTANRDEAWVREKARGEDKHTVSVGGWVSELRASSPEDTLVVATRSAFGRFVTLMRLRHGLSWEQFAQKADIAVEELLSIESDESYVARPRTIHQLGVFFHVPPAKLMCLAGLATPRDERFSREAVRFAAKSEPIRKLSKQEREALDEFVKFLSAS